MKKMIALVVLALASTSAFADGFVCRTQDGFTVKVFNNTDPEAGTRNAAAMILADDTVGYGRKTIARFTDVNGTVTQDGASYTANVDLRFSDSSRKGELFLGTKLGFIDTIKLNVFFNYNYPIANGEQREGRLIVLKRDGEKIRVSVDCTRYLKN